MQSYERKGGEQQVIGDCLRTLVEKWKTSGEFERLQCIEYLLGIDLYKRWTALFGSTLQASGAIGVGMGYFSRALSPVPILLVFCIPLVTNTRHVPHWPQPLQFMNLLMPAPNPFKP